LQYLPEVPREIKNAVFSNCYFYSPHFIFFSASKSP
jgi:hypothetical protein